MCGRSRKLTGGDGRSPPAVERSRCGRQTAGSSITSIPKDGLSAVPIQPGPGFIAGNPQVIVDGPFARILPGITGRMYDVSRDGQRFLMIKAWKRPSRRPAAKIVVVQNWTDELKRLAPANQLDESSAEAGPTS